MEPISATARSAAVLLRLLDYRHPPAMLLMIHCSWPFLGQSVQRELQFRNEKYKLIGEKKTNNRMGSSSEYSKHKINLHLVSLRKKIEKHTHTAHEHIEPEAHCTR